MLSPRVRRVQLGFLRSKKTSSIGSMSKNFCPRGWGLAECSEGHRWPPKDSGGREPGRRRHGLIVIAIRAVHRTLQSRKTPILKKQKSRPVPKAAMELNSDSKTLRFFPQTKLLWWVPSVPAPPLTRHPHPQPRSIPANYILGSAHIPRCTIYS